MSDLETQQNFLRKVQGLTLNIDMIRPAICVGAGIFVIAFNLNHYIELYRASHWPSVKGVVTEVEVNPARKANLYSVKVRYDYPLEGRVYNGEQSSFDYKPSSVGYGSDMGPYFNLADSNSIKQEFAARSEHPVHVDPADPKHSFIDTRFDLFDFKHNGGILTGVAFLLLGIVILFSSFRSNKQLFADLEKR
jgi:Protein of unknown function (DUF3592)